MHVTGCAVTLLVVVLYLHPGPCAASSWSAGAGFRSLPVRPVGTGKPGFTLLTAKETGVSFTNELRGDAYLTNAVAHNGAGLALGDVDGDGWVDLYLSNLEGPNRLYRNLGNWRFEEMNLGEAACAGQFSTGTALADIDGDGDLDLLVNGIRAGTRLFLNNGKGQWTEMTNSGLSRTASPTSLALADIDGDGDLDLYCAHYIDVMHLADPTTRFALARRGDQWEVTKVHGQSTRLPQWKDRFQALPDGRLRELPEPDALYRNEGGGRFTAIQTNPGVFLDELGKAVAPHRDWGLAVMLRDLNQDGFPDLFVCNDNASPDRVWINSGTGSFRAMDPMAFRHTSRSSMALDIADLDRDGHDDVLVLDMLAREHAKRMTQLVRDYPDPEVRERIEEQPRYNRNTLFFGRPDGSYAEAAFFAGIAATDWSWCPVFIDVDLDGYEDLLVSNGFAFDVMDQDSHDLMRRRKMPEHELKRSRQLHPQWPTRNASFRNRGDGSFEPMDGSWGFDRLGISYGMALADLDNDGDLDVVVNNLNDSASLYRNETTAGRIAVQLKGLPPNTRGIGARIRLTGGSVTQSQEMICGGRYLSSDDAVRVFAAGAGSTGRHQLQVQWRTGDVSTIEAQPNRIYELDQAHASKPAAAPRALPSEPFFRDASSLLEHVHVEDAFDDWSRQPLLPRRLSRLGPGVCWYDFNGDGWEDLAVSAARGGKLAVYLNGNGQRFQRMDGAFAAPADQGALVGWPDGNGKRYLLAAISDYAMRSGQESQIAAFSWGALSEPEQWPAGEPALGPLALADIDGDGDLDLFVGGRLRPGWYPEPVSSTLWLNGGGKLQPSAALSKSFESVGLVSGATFCDLDGDGDPDLALALEWGPVRLFENQNGVFGEVTAQRGLDAHPGWWTSIAAGDFDNDGRLDLAVGNWGRNSFYELYQPGPLRIFYDDLNDDGQLELIEAWQNRNHWLPVRSRTWLERAMPGLRQQFTSHERFGQATVREILGSRYQTAKTVDAGHLESAVFLNRGSHFQRMPLPKEAQMSPVFSINVGDFDGDGNEDLFLSQNCFGSASDLSRDDSGRGLWLKGTGTGAFQAVDATASGILLHGSQRGAALADFNQDGRVDLAVSQNDGPTKLYINQHAKRGLRVVLQGSAANPDAIGAHLRVRYAGGRAGPSRAVAGGSGYWSQDGAVQVLGLGESPVSLWIRWPSGQERTVPLPDRSLDLQLHYETQ